MEKHLEDLVQACGLIQEYNSVDEPGMPKVVALTILTYDGEVMQLVPARLADDILQREATKELMNNCECTSCDCPEDLDEVLADIDKQLSEIDKEEKMKDEK